MKRTNPIPPKRAERLLQWFIRDELAEEVLGDLEEKFYSVLEAKSLFRAQVNYWYQVLHYLRPFAIRHLHTPSFIHTAMYKHYFKVSWRNLLRDKIQALLNISGLTVGMACSLLILLWVQHERSYDQFHANAENIYRLTANAREFKAAISPAAMAEGLQSEIPTIQAATRLSHPYTALFEVGDKKLEEQGVFYADSNFLEVFSFPLLQGNAQTALLKPDGLLITVSAAQKYFGTEDPMGKIMKVDNESIFTVSGVLADIPANSHLQFNILLPMAKIAKTDYDLVNNSWENFDFYNYFKFSEQAISSFQARTELEQKIDEIWASHVTEFEVNFRLQPLQDIHLHSDLQIDVAGHGSIQYVNTFSIIALVILLVACINFMNLATARAGKRAREVGLRKVVGARRRQLIVQFLSESTLITFLALSLAIGIVMLVLPVFNDLSGKELTLRLLEEKVWLELFGIALFTGLFSGSYPALLLSGFQPVKVLKGNLRLAGSNHLFRNGLVTAQFVVSILLLIGTGVVYKQLKFIQHKNLGFDKENLVYIPMTGEIWSRQEALETALAQHPLTQSYSIVSDLPANLMTGTVTVEWDGKDPNSQVVVPHIAIDEQFMEVFGVELIRGRNFSKERTTDAGNYIVNEQAVQMMGAHIDSVVGKRLSFVEQEGIIIGVVKDFHVKPLQYAIDPMILKWNEGGGFVMVRTTPGQTALTIDALGKIYKGLNPAFPFAYHFLNQNLENQYQEEQQMGTLFNLFAILALFISCLGLYGLSAFVAEERTKEIGIRKVLGAGIPGLVTLLSKDFFRLVAFAFLLATPLSWYLMNQWLQGFAYHAKFSWWIFAGSGLAILAITLLTVSYQVIRTALTNPVNSLRSE